MNFKQRTTWEGLVQQCRSQSYSSINVASKLRSDAIMAAAELVELVTPELTELLERLANDAEYVSIVDEPYLTAPDADEARALAARIREALTAEMTNPLHQK